MKITVSLWIAAAMGAACLAGCASDNPSGLSGISFPQDKHQTLVSAKPPLATTIKADQTTQTSAPRSVLTTLGPNQDLDELVRIAPGVVLLDFYADWCGPCKKQGAILHDLENSAASKNASIVKINVDQHKELADKFKVSALPTLLLVKDGKVVDIQRGLASRTKVTSLLSR